MREVTYYLSNVLFSLSAIRNQVLSKLDIYVNGIIGSKNFAIP